MYEHISVADGFERLARKQAVLSLGLLKANNLGRPLRDQPPHIVQPEADRVDVPSDEAHNYGASRGVRLGAGPQRNTTKHRRPVGGEPGRLHVRSVWGKLDPQGRRVRSKEGLLPSPLPKPGNGVGQKSSKVAIRAWPE